MGASNQPPPASNLTYRPQICPPDLQLGLQASNQPSVAQICPPNLKFTLKASILPSSLQICLLWPESVIYCQKYASSGRMEIPPCVLQDIGPLGPLPCSHSTSSLDHLAGHRVPLTMCDPWMTSFFLSFSVSSFLSFFPLCFF